MNTLKAVAIRNHPRVAMQSIDSAQVSDHNGICCDAVKSRNIKPGDQLELV